MTSRDRTGLFLRYREEAKTLHSAPHSFLDDDINDVNDKVDPRITDEGGRQENRGGARLRRKRAHMQPDWVFTHGDLRGDIAEIQKMLNELSSLYAKHLLPSFGDVDTSELEHDIRIRSRHLTELVHSAEKKVRNLIKGARPASSERDVEREILRNMQKRFGTPLQELSVSFRKKQKVYLEKLKENKEVSVHQSNSSANIVVTFDEQNDDYLEMNSSESQLLSVERTSTIARERQAQLESVGANVNDLAALVKDLAGLVVDQGTVLDRIDYNLEDVNVNMFKAVRELRIADRNDRKRHALCCILIMSIACSVMFIILVYKVTKN